MSPKQVSQTIHLCYDRVIGGGTSSIQQKHTWGFHMISFTFAV